jgi:hypothetical protein
MAFGKSLQEQAVSQSITAATLLSSLRTTLRRNIRFRLQPATYF